MKITPSKQISISAIVLNVILSFFKIYTTIKVVHNGFVFCKTTASDTETSFSDKKQLINPMLPITPLRISFFIVPFFFG